MNQAEYDKKYEYNRESSGNWLSKKVDNYGNALTRKGFVPALKRRVRCIKWLEKYKPSEMLISDLIAGITVGIYNVPQAMSYSTLAGLPPVYGLYASFFPPLFYSIFGSATHSSIGVFSITCLMVNKCSERMLNHENKEDFPGLTKIQAITSLCVLTGIIQAVMAIVRCDKLMKFLSEPAISAITFSACFFGVVTQIPKFCGFSVPSRNEPYFGLFYSIYAICTHLTKTNLVTLCVSSCSMAFLVLSKIFIDPMVESYDGILKGIPFPKELITIILAILASHFLNLEQNYGVKTLHTVPRGFPSPDIPRTDIWTYIIQDAFSIAIVAYAVTMAMGQIFARKHKYRIDSNQELLALGLINIGSSFFSVFPTSCSLSRTLVNERCGAKSQLSGIISAIVILFVILFVGPLLEALPNCVLAAIVLVVVEPLLRNITKLPRLWRCSKHDFWIWIFTAIVTLCTDIAQGVAAGISFAILSIAIQSQQFVFPLKLLSSSTVSGQR
uniref:Sulfate_transp domain-containing protein n=1 Tax=Caenorhabditis tropicalis TaxID=1561998 RepID=A0A1I7TJS1_9PELO